MSAHEQAASMDRIYRYQRHIYDLTRKYYLFGRDRAIAQLGPIDQPAGLLEIGCGTGRNLCLAARRYPALQGYGLDASAQMLATASSNIAKYRLGRQISLAAGDATDFDPLSLFGRARFDRVLIPYAVSMIPQWQRALILACQATAAGGSIQCVDFGRQENLPGWVRKGLRAWLRQFQVTPRDELAGEFVAIGRDAGLVNFRQQSFGGGYGVLLSAECPPG